MDQQRRREVNALRAAARGGDPWAARLLLSRSVALRHERLTLRRYYAARFLAAGDLSAFMPFCREAAGAVPAAALLAAARETARAAGETGNINIVASELLKSESPLVLPYDGVMPRLAAPPARCGVDVALLGRLELGRGAWFGPGSVVRADGHFIRIGDDFRLGAGSTVHIAHNVYPTICGSRLTVGADAVVHACTIGDDCVVEDEVVVLDGSVVEDGVVIEAGSTVYPRSSLKAGMLYAGSPAKPVRPLEPGEAARRALALSEAIAASLFAERTGAASSRELGPGVFVARTASLSGRIEAGEGASIFFGCQLDAASARIVIGANCNIQDITRIDASEGDVVIAENTTLGHNVHVRACAIGPRALIGIGSRIAPGTVVEEDVLLAAGAFTELGQRLAAGWLWGGRPARAIAPLDDAKRRMMAATIVTYGAYGEAYARLQGDIAGMTAMSAEAE